MKKIIATVILAVLIVAAFSMLSTPRVKAQSSEAQVVSYSWYVAPANTEMAENPGDLVIVGEVQNNGSNVLQDVAVIGSAFNSTGTLNFDVVQAYGRNLLPGQKAPFYIDLTPEGSITGDNTYISSVTNVTVTVSGVTDTNSTPYSGLTSTVTSASDVDGTFTVAGTIHNSGNEATGDVWVCGTFYNASGTVIATNITYYLTDSLPIGASVPFTVTPTDNTAQLSSEITNYTLLLQSEPPTSTSPTPSPPPSATPTPSSSASTQPTRSPAPASALTYGTYGAAATVVVIVVILVALLLLRKRHKNEEFEPPPPPPLPPPPP